ncbi:hypothetical protein FRC00_002130, partial [Tulasnella sp. 408]
VEAKSVDAANQLVKLLQAIKESAKITEPGTLDFRIYQFEEKLLLLEEYEDETALQTHFKNETVKAFLEAIPSLATGIEAKSIDAANQLTKHLLAKKGTAKTSDPGILSFRIYQFEEKLMLIEEYEDEKALQAHRQSEGFKAFSEAVSSLTAAGGTLNRFGWLGFM